MPVPAPNPPGMKDDSSQVLRDLWLLTAGRNGVLKMTEEVSTTEDVSTVARELADRSGYPARSKVQGMVSHVHLAGPWISGNWLDITFTHVSNVWKTLEFDRVMT